MRSYPSLLIVGCGDVGKRLARAHGINDALGMTRTTDSAWRLRAEGIQAFAWDLDTPSATPPTTLAEVECVVYLAPPPASGSRDQRLKRFLAECASSPTRLVYLSTTGVYGDADGAEVDEDTPIQPQSERAHRRADAEAQIRTYCTHRAVPWTILRVPGIYGPGRLNLDRLRRQEPLIRPTEAGFSNRIHVDDLVMALILATRSPHAANRIYNVTDGASSSMTDYFLTLAALTGLPEPPLISRQDAIAQLTPGMLSYVMESRRVLSTRIMRELGFRPRYPDLRDGLIATLAADNASAG